MAAATISGETPAGRSFFARIHGALSLQKSKRSIPPQQPPPPVLLVPSPGRGLERVFNYFDENGDGKISAAELCVCLRTVGEEMSPEAAEEVVESSDSDGDGMLGYEDFARLVNGDEAEEEERARTLRLAFAAYEAEGKGCITVASLRRALRRLGEERSAGDCGNMIKRFDLDGNGVICFDEFKLMML